MFWFLGSDAPCERRGTYAASSVHRLVGHCRIAARYVRPSTIHRWCRGAIGGERMHFKLLDDVKKFECVYQGRFSQRAARELLAYAEEALRRAVHSRTSISEVVFDTHCLAFGPVQFTSGADQEATVERLFSEVVVMSATERAKSAEFESLDTPSVRQLVNTELKRIARMDFEKIVTAESQGILLDYEGQKHFLDLNLLTLKDAEASPLLSIKRRRVSR